MMRSIRWIVKKIFTPRQDDFSFLEGETARLQSAVDGAARDSLRGASAGLGVLFAILTFSHPITLPAEMARVMAPLSALTAVVFLSCYLYLSRRSAANQHDHTLGLVITSLTIVNNLALIYLSGNPSQTATLALLFAGSGYLLLSTHHLAMVIGTSLLSWLVIARVSLPDSGWIYSGALLVLGVLLAIILHSTRLQHLHRLEKLRLQNERHKKELEQVLKTTEEAQRSLATSMAIGQRIASILDLDVLLGQVAYLIQDRFGCSFVGIFLLDERHEWAISRAGTGEVGRKLTESGFRLKVGEQGLVGWVAARRRPARVDNVALDVRYFHHQVVNDTRSELALPLEMGASLLGVLDMQSTEPSAFHEEDVPYLQMVADQVAIALQNAQLFDQIRRFNLNLEEMIQERTQALQAAYDQLEQLDRTKTDFISVASHELRTPITVLQGYTQMLMDDPVIKNSPYHLQLISGIFAGTARLNEIVNSLLDTAKIDSRALHIYPTPVVLSSLVDLVCSGLQPSFRERKQSLVLHGLKDLPPIQADPDALRKAFYQVIVNAIKYTPDGGEITISGQCIGGDRESNNVKAVEISIRDTGIGIDPSVQEVIFSKFYQTGQVALHSSGKAKFKGGGPGLGLAIARGIIEAHSGRIWVESPGYDEVNYPGSQFHILLPVQQ